MSLAVRGELAVAAGRALAGRCGVPEGTPILVACSGGADSIALADALSRLADRWPLAGIAFVDHGLRSIEDERAAAGAAAARAGVPFHSLRATLPAGGNVQASARHARYRLLVEEAGPDALVATGHTRSDQAETVLQRAVRGVGLRGLSAIRARRGRVVRPLLEVPRSLTRAAGLPFVDDPTNATDTYQRNRMRHEILPLLAEHNPRVEEALARLATEAADELALLDALARRLPFGQADLTGVDPELAALWVRWRLRTEGAPAAGRAAVDTLAERLSAGAPDGRVDLGRGVEGRARSGRLALIERPDARKVLVAPGPGSYRLGRVRLELVEGQGPPRVGAPSDEVDVPRPVETWLDTARLVWPLTLAPADDGWRLADGAGRELWRTGAGAAASGRAEGRPYGLRVRLYDGMSDGL